MIALWIGIGLLSLLAAVFLLWPLWRATGLRKSQLTAESEDRHNAENVAIYRQRLAALKASLAANEIDRERFNADSRELERRLLEDADAQHQRPLAMSTTGRWLLPVVVICVIGGSLLTYQHLGASENLALYETVQSLQDAPLKRQQAGLEAMTRRQPQNPEAWAQLYPVYRDSGQYTKAADVAKKLIDIKGRQPSLVGHLAQAEFLAAHRTITVRVQSLLDEALKRDPRQPVANEVLGIAAFDHERYGEAISHWRKSIAGYQDPQAIKALKRVIGIAQQRMDDTGGKAVQANMRVKLALAPRLTGRFAADTSVFLVARDPDSDGSPLAVTRTTLGNLPQALTLSDANAMMPNSKLAQAEHVELIARVSASGQAKPHPGDLYGTLSDVDVSSSDQRLLVIDSVVSAQ